MDVFATLLFLRSSLIRVMGRLAKRGRNVAQLEEQLFKVEELIHESESMCSGPAYFKNQAA
ncbi:MAG: hypothetical protein JWM99_2937 [Verrucomicrobiales bacterium]|nr:hypothetical protein [Verrucomicrobiales bacterium]